MSQIDDAPKPRSRTTNEWRILFEESTSAIYIAGNDGRFTIVNQSAADLLGYGREELLRLSVGDICADATDWDILKRTVEEEGHARASCIRLVKKDGAQLVCMMTATLRTHSNGRGKGYHGTIHDMTDREREALALRESEERFRQLSDASFEGIVILDKCEILAANQTYARYCGYEAHELVGRNAVDFVAPEYRDYAYKAIMSDYEGLDQVATVSRDGTRSLAEVSTRHSYYQGRRVRIAAVRDLTERMRMENDLRESEEKLRIMFESITEGVLVYALDGRIVQLNDAMAQLHGPQPKEEILNRNVIDLVAPKDRARAKRNMTMGLRTVGAHSVEYLCLRHDGSKYNAELSASLMRNKAGDPTGYVAVIRDITERKRAEINRQFYVSEITKVHEEERRRLARELHDETVQSLSALLLDIEAINSKGSRLPVETVRRLASLRSETNEIVRKIRRYSHELRPVVLDRQGLGAALELLVGELEEKGVTARLSISGEDRRLPPEAELALFRIAQEAMRNVRKHSQATECLVELSFAPHKVDLVVMDNGNGFDLSTEQNEFATKGKLGIIGMEERASLIGANFLAQSSPGKGTTVKVVLQA